jgi:hypothetical protein
MAREIGTSQLRIDERELRLDLEHGLADRFGRRRSIAAIRRRPSPYASSFTIEQLDVVFTDGAELELVMKDMSPDSMGASARRARPGFLYEPNREIRAYRHILPFAPPGTAAWYGAVANTAANRYRLFLERVDGLELRHVGAIAIWEDAVRWIARFHRSFSSTSIAELKQRSRLLVYDEAFYWLWLERAQRFAAGKPAARPVVDRIARRYAPVVERLAAMPRTLIHGELYPCNVLVGQTTDHVRICPVDWEMAALGPALVDVASLTTGWSQEQQHALIRTYRAAAAGDRSADADVSNEFGHDLVCCRLYLAVRMLGWSDAWTPPPQHAHDWLAEAASIVDRL